MSTPEPTNPPSLPFLLWRTQLQQASQKPWLAALLLKRAHRLAERIHYFYQQLINLPRRWRRRVQKIAAAGLVSAALLLAWSPAPSVHAATITISTNTVPLADDGYCSLVEAITNANNDSQLYTTSGECDAGSGADTIVLSGNTYSYNAAFGSSTALPDITSEITIAGNNSTIERASGAATNFRLLRVPTGGDLTLNQVTLTGGSVTNGGGVANEGGATTINNSSINSNTALSQGGGLFINGGSLVLNNSRVSGNSASASGGGVSLRDNGSLTINSSTIDNNSAPSGGGIASYVKAYYFNAAGAVTINNSTISGNTATGTLGGGGIVNRAYAYTVNSADAIMTINNSTITGNGSTNSGGGIGNRADAIAGTPTATLTLNRTLISGNTGATGSELANTAGAAIVGNNYNLFGESSKTNAQAFFGVTAGASDITATSNGTNPTHLSDILNPTLANNGGPTLTHALVTVSPAIDEAPAAACAAAPIGGLDQTGAARAGGAGNGGIACDIGAVEVANPSYPTEISATPGAAGLNGYDGCSLVEAIITANTDVPTGGCLDVGGADTILLAGNTYTYYVAYGSSTALPNITSNVTIEGNNSTLERNSGAPNFRVLQVDSSGNLTLNQVTLSGGMSPNGGGLYVRGTATINNSTLSGNNGFTNGGGMAINGGTVTMGNSTVNGNLAARGAGIAVFGSSSTLTVNNSTLSGNTASSVGGGLSVYARSNYNPVIHTVTLNNSTLSGNSAATGGGISNLAYDYTNNPTQATVTLNNSTLSGNSATNGGGIANREFPFYSGQNATVNLHRTVVSGNSAGTGGELFEAAANGNIVANDYNLLGHSSLTNAQAFSGVNPGASDITATRNGTNPTHLSDILNPTLANNGGPTLTHALVPVSPAIDEAPAAACAVAPIGGLDQTGATRAGGAGNGGIACDIGAVEYANPGYPTQIITTPGAAGLNGYDGCSLVEAIITANTDVPTGGCLDVGGADTILLSGNTYTYNAAYGLTTALPSITSEITVEGNNSTIERDSGAATNFRLMRVDYGGNLTLNQVTLTGGDPGNNIGGGMFVAEGEATVNGSTINGNTAVNGGGIGVRGFGTLTINQSTISGNSASQLGGGLYAYKHYEAYPNPITVTVNDSTISGNSAQRGGGISSRAYSYLPADVTVTVNNSTISGNTATLRGGGVYNSSFVYNGGPNQAIVILNNSTLTGNSAARGGGVYNLWVNSPAKTYLHRSIVSGNSATVGDELGSAGGTHIYLNDYNLIGHSGQTNADAFIGVTPGASDITATSDGTIPTVLSNILNTTLADNGGETFTHALVTGSPALDVVAIDGLVCDPPNTVDQRGAVRADGVNRGGPACDIGAYELSSETPTAVTLRSFSAHVQTNGLWAALLAVAGLLVGVNGRVWQRRRHNRNQYKDTTQ